jgi:hypothetical protein
MYSGLTCVNADSAEALSLTSAQSDEFHSDAGDSHHRENLGENFYRCSIFERVAAVEGLTKNAGPGSAWLLLMIALDASVLTIFG